MTVHKPSAIRPVRSPTEIRTSQLRTALDDSEAHAFCNQNSAISNRDLLLDSCMDVADCTGRA